MSEEYLYTFKDLLSGKAGKGVFHSAWSGKSSFILVVEDFKNGSRNGVNLIYFDTSTGLLEMCNLEGGWKTDTYKKLDWMPVIYKSREIESKFKDTDNMTAEQCKELFNLFTLAKKNFSSQEIAQILMGDFGAMGYCFAFGNKET